MKLHFVEYVKFSKSFQWNKGTGSFIYHFLPQLFNRQQVNRKPVVDIVHDSENQEILLKLKSSRPGSPNGEQEVLLSEEIVKKLYEMFIR